MCNHQAIVTIIEPYEGRKLALVECYYCRSKIVSCNLEETPKSFKTKEEALNYLKHKYEEDCGDNYRFAFLSGDSESLETYRQRYLQGCCGFEDRIVLVNGEKAVLGCNYGH